MAQEYSDIAISETGIIGGEDMERKSNKTPQPIQVLSAKYNAVNNLISELAQLEAESQEELTDIKKEIAELTKSLKSRQKDLRQTLKAISERRMMVLGERTAYMSQIRALGGKVGTTDIKKLLGTSKRS